MNSKDFSFPPNYLWGTAVSAAQVEGACNIDGKLPSIWDDFVLKKNKIQQKIKADKNGVDFLESANFYKHFKDDIQLLKQLKFKAFRFSTAWSRILPNGIGQINPKGIDFYKQLIDELLANNIEPWLTIYHWDLPLALQKKGGWLNRDILHWFEEFTQVLLQNFGESVKHWMVLNEPLAFTAAGHFLGVHAPGKIGINNFTKATHHALLIQANTGRQIKNFNPKLNVGTTFSATYITPFTQNKKDLDASKRVDALYNRLFLEPYLGLGLPKAELPFLKRIEKYTKADDNYAFNADFIGIQNYTREVAKHSLWMPYIKAGIVPAEKRNVPITAMKWEILPESIYHILKQINQYPNLPPVYLTEVGAAFKDKITENGEINDIERIQFFEKYFEQVLKAHEENYTTKGLFVWSLLDNFEWAEAYMPRFGLVHVDFNTQKRTIKDSGKWFREMLKNKGNID